MNFDPATLEQEENLSGRPSLVVLLSGLLTTVLALAGVYWLSKNARDFHIMGWYANFIIPIGAMIVGCVAASGYALASWLTGTRISRFLLLSVLLIQTAAYVGAEYVEYTDVMEGLRLQGLAPGQEPSFLEYYDFKARNFTWKDDKVGKQKQPEKPLGGLGYVFVLLGAAGFILGGLIAPALLYAVPYCARCQQYMKTKSLGAFPASVPPKKIAKRDTAAQQAHDQEQAQAAAQAEEALIRLQAVVKEGNPQQYKKEMLAFGASSETQKLPRRISLSLSWCKRCQQGKITETLHVAEGNTAKPVKLDEYPVPAEFVSGLLE